MWLLKIIFQLGSLVLAVLLSLLVALVLASCWDTLATGGFETGNTVFWVTAWLVFTLQLGLSIGCES